MSSRGTQAAPSGPATLPAPVSGTERVVLRVAVTIDWDRGGALEDAEGRRARLDEMQEHIARDLLDTWGAGAWGGYDGPPVIATEVAGPAGRIAAAADDGDEER